MYYEMLIGPKNMQLVHGEVNGMGIIYLQQVNIMAIIIRGMMDLLH